MTSHEREAKMAQARMAAGALFFDAEGRVLMVEPSYKDYWEIPGGYVEIGESPLQACVREVREELGITPPIGPLLAVDWAPSDREGDKVLYLFDGGQLAAGDLAAISLQAEELLRFGFCSVDAVPNRTIPRLARRIVAAARARKSGSPVYLEHGQPVGSSTA
ncbi:NUDIX domain-containing protein [Kitasatospora purpeofusca]|uniref:NUDIX domain-containing protein n=1 Tax=Kitasatospora purpeofusca TaxID=67352 RepID=UPI0037FEF34A